MANVLMTFFGAALSLSCGTVFSFMDMEELKSVYYGLDILNDPVVISQDIPVGAVHVTSKYGQQYQCSFPNHNLDEKRKEEEEKIAIETGIVDMLKPMGLNDCLFKSKDWWSYEFCFGKYIRQFHMEDGEIKGNIIYLGYYHEDFDWNNETAREDRLKSKSVLNRYHSQLYTLGTRCDLTDQMRRAEVRFICEENSEDYLSRVDESETCVYTVTVMTSRICRHPYLKAPAKRKAVPITCNPLLSVDDFVDYMQSQKEKQKQETALKAAAKEALSKKDGSTLGDWSFLSEKLENEMSIAAKETLIKQFSQSLLKDGMSTLTKEEFQKLHGNDELAWKTYQEGLKLKQQLAEIQLRQKESLKDTEADEKAETETDEDEEIISQFQKEISTIKEKFQSSKDKLSNIKKKLAIERHWESEIENTIKEAEQELGVKFDQSLITGLSSTLDKLVSTLYDTERELSSADKELGKLKPGKKILRNSNDENDDHEDDKELRSDNVESNEEEDEVAENGEEAEDAFEDNQEVDKEIFEPDKKILKNYEEEKDDHEDDEEFHSDKVRNSEDKDRDVEEAGDALNDNHDVVINRHEEVGTIKSSFSEEHAGDHPHDKIQAPPKLKDKSHASQKPHHVDSKGDNQNDEIESAKDSIMNELKAKLEITVKNVENKDADLPKNVQKLLEDSVRKELKQQADSEALTFDADHSFSRDKSVHIIQQEDEDGKTNRFIFVFGFNTFNDEAAEKKKHSSLEENYSFVYYKKKRDKQVITA